MGRARSLVEGIGDCPERGWVELIVALFTEELEEKERHVTEAMAIAKRLGETELEFSGLGRIEEGMGRLDEAIAAATAGVVKDLGAVGDIYCKMLLPCELAPRRPTRRRVDDGRGRIRGRRIRSEKSRARS